MMLLSLPRGLVVKRIGIRSLSAASLTSSSAKVKPTLKLTPDGRVPTPWDGPERDYENFPHPVIAPKPPPVRFAFLPEYMFTNLYSKIGVTGGYTFLWGGLATLFSKEIWVLDHEFGNLIGFICIIVGAHKLYGAKIKDWMTAKEQVDIDIYEERRLASIRLLEEQLNEYEAQKNLIQVQELVIAAKKENVGLQLEAAHREHLSAVHNKVKRIMDYHSDTAHVKKTFEQKHMVSWILDGVQKSFTPQYQKRTLEQCLSDLASFAKTA